MGKAPLCTNGQPTIIFMPPKQSRKPKSHRGCTACRASKRKCSEEKPACENCVRDGKACEYDIDGLIRIQTYDGTQQPNRRRRQIITPLPRLAEPPSSTPRTSPNLNQSVPTSPSSSSVNMDTAVSYPFARRNSLSSMSIPPRRSPPKSRRQRSGRVPSRPQPTPYPIADASSTSSVRAGFMPPLVEPFFIFNFDPSMPLSTSSSPGPSRNPSISIPGDTVDPASLNVTPQHSTSPGENIYVAFFLREVPALLPFTELFPSVCSDILALSLENIPLFQAILAISSYLSDHRADIPPVTGLLHLQKTLSRVNEAISLGIVDEGLIASVFLLALLSTLSADYKGSRRHLEGFSHLIQIYQQGRTLRVTSGTSTSSADSYALVMLLWRMAIRMEYHVAFYDHGQGPPIFPINDTSQERTQIEWISKIISKSIPNGIDWALASFALDDLMNRAGHLSHRLNGDGVHMINRSLQVHDLIEEHQNWKRRPIINQFMIETLSLPPDNTINPSLMHSTAPSFLHYPSVRISNNLFAALLIRHFMIGIYLSLIGDPRPGPVSRTRFQYAIDICRYFVTLYGDPPLHRNDMVLRPVDNCMAIITAGFTFQEDAYPQEFEYCTRTLAAIAQETGFASLMDVVEILKATHRKQGGQADWAREFQLKIESPSPGSRWAVPAPNIGPYVDPVSNLVQ